MCRKVAKGSLPQAYDISQNSWIHVNYYIIISGDLNRIEAAIRPVKGTRGFKYQASDCDQGHICHGLLLVQQKSHGVRSDFVGNLQFFLDYVSVRSDPVGDRRTQMGHWWHQNSVRPQTKSDKVQRTFDGVVQSPIGLRWTYVGVSESQQLVVLA